MINRSLIPPIDPHCFPLHLYYQKELLTDLLHWHYYTPLTCLSIVATWRLFTTRTAFAIRTRHIKYTRRDITPTTLQELVIKITRVWLPRLH